MPIIIYSIIVLIFLALAVWAVDAVGLGDARVRGLIKALFAVLAIVVIAQRAGVLSL